MTRLLNPMQPSSYFDLQYIRNFCPRHFSHFEFVPSDGASGGLLIAWNGFMFDGQLASSNSFSIIVKMTSHLIAASFHLTNIYGPLPHLKQTCSSTSYIIMMHQSLTTGF